MPNNPSNIPLTGTDCFILALEKHDKNKDSSGNTCRYIIDLDGDLSLEHLKAELDKNETIQWLSDFYIATSLFSKKWKIKKNSLIQLNKIESETTIPQQILKRKLNKAVPPLFCFDLIKRKNNTTTLIFSWHHLIMDGYGAVLLLKSLAKVLPSLPPKHQVATINTTLKKAVQSKKFLDETSKGSASDLLQNSTQKSTQSIKIIRFSKTESQQIENNAKAAKAVFGISPFYLACLSLAIKNTLTNRKEKNINFWIPVPQDNRKKGATSPIIGNHLSFLFYRIFNTDLTSINACVASINKQMLHQIKMALPKAYQHLMGYLKYIPSSIYYQLIKGPKGKSLSSFLFTIAADHPKELENIFGCKILNAISLPPNTYPPGVTAAFSSFNEQIQVAILYYNDVLSEDEIVQIEQDLKANLLETA